MITKDDLKYLYKWVKNKNFYLKKEPSSLGVPTKPLLFCPLKLSLISPVIRRSLLDEKVYEILSNPEILFCGYLVFQNNTEHGPHKDLNIYIEEYKRIQIPLKTPNQDSCYMMWKGEKVLWVEGKPQVFEVMDYVHEAYNYSEEDMKFLFLDVKKDTEIYLK